MKRRHTTNRFNFVNPIELSKKTAIHEAGHAVAIYFGNKQKQLPPVFFQIIINNHANENYLTEIEGGRLIHTLPIPEKTNSNLPLAQQRLYQQAVEADIINLLAGSLAEAHYVAYRDNELISPRLVPLYALHNYGGSSDLAVIDEYLQYFIANKVEQEKKITELFWNAFDFINHGLHWSAITALADYILEHDKSVIDYKEVATVLDTHYSRAEERVLY